MLFSRTITRFVAAGALLASSVCIAANTATDAIGALDDVSDQVTSAAELVEGTDIANVLPSNGMKAVNDLQTLATVFEGFSGDQDGSAVYDKEGQDDVVTTFINFQGILAKYMTALINAHQTYDAVLLASPIDNGIKHLEATFDAYASVLLDSLPDDLASAQAVMGQIDGSFGEAIEEYYI